MVSCLHIADIRIPCILLDGADIGLSREPRMHVTLDAGKKQLEPVHFRLFQPRLAVSAEKQFPGPANEWRF